MIVKAKLFLFLVPLLALCFNNCGSYQSAKEVQADLGSEFPQAKSCSGEDFVEENPIKRHSKIQLINTVRDILSEGIKNEHVLEDVLVNQYERMIPEDFAEFDRLDSSIDVLYIQGAFQASLEISKKFTGNPSRTLDPLLKAFIKKKVTSCSKELSQVNSSQLEDDCLRDFVVNFGLRIFKRPLSEDEIQSAMVFYNSNESASPVEKLCHTIHRFMISPEFLFNIDVSSESRLLEEDVVELDSYAIARRLSYRLWDSLPDDKLFKMAENFDLSQDGPFEAALEYVLSRKNKVNTSLVQFIYQWLNIRSSGNIGVPLYNNPRNLAALEDHGVYYYGEKKHLPHARFLNAAHQEVSDFFLLLLNQNATFMDLFTSNISVTKSEMLAKLYNVEPEERSLDEITPANAKRFAEDQRAGLLTRTAVLFDSSINAHPIHRSIRIRERFLCEFISDPPPDIDGDQLAKPENLGDKLFSTRELYQRKTSPSLCMGCHQKINPFGFVLSRYDGFGAYNEQEIFYSLKLQRSTVETDDEVDFTGVWGNHQIISGPIEFSKAVGESREARYCFAEKLVSHFNGLPANIDNNICQIALVSSHLKSKTLKEALFALFNDPSFRRLKR